MTNEQILNIFADNFNFYISQLGYTQKDIAEKLGVTQQAVNTWATGKNVPRMDKAQKLAQILNVKISDLTESRVQRDSVREIIERRPDLQEVMELLSKCDKEKVDAISKIIRVLTDK